MQRAIRVYYIVCEEAQVSTMSFQSRTRMQKGA